jgi:hypothetical protein
VTEAQGSRHLRLRYAGVCQLCGASLAKGVGARYFRDSRTVQCLECPTAGGSADQLAVDAGIAGGSAQREYERRKAARAARVKGRFGNLLGGIALAVIEDPQSTRAWKTGALGEQKLAEALRGVPNLKALHDRRVPRTRGNIDHILIAPAGVFVVDAKNYSGMIRIRNKGGLFKADDRLYVGSRDCSHLADNMGWQVEVVRSVLESAALGAVPVTPVLCFVDGEWPLFSPPESYAGVRLEGKRSIKNLITRAEVLDTDGIDTVYRSLGTALPANSGVRL